LRSVKVRGRLFVILPNEPGTPSVQASAKTSGRPSGTPDEGFAVALAAKESENVRLAYLLDQEKAEKGRLLDQLVRAQELQMNLQRQLEAANEKAAALPAPAADQAAEAIERTTKPLAAALLAVLQRMKRRA
jgi:hypothetical protein